MYLKRLVLQGFKSFAQRTALEFNSGITVIVGPNGSGKSNIADALRWILGEQSLKALRAKEGEDLIFGGGRARGQIGMAEAMLTFDNSPGWLPIDFSEVSVGRRIYRSGESEYLINRSQVRRKDVIELLGKAGVGANPYTIIGQGLVDQALYMRPEERRRLFEEAAGLTLYKAKRDQAVEKLGETQDNLRRIQDILQEISPRLAGLKRLAERAEKQQSMAQELETLLLSWYGYQWHNTRHSLQMAEEKGQMAQQDLEGHRNRLQQLREKAEEDWKRESFLREELQVWEKEREAISNRHQEFLRELAVRGERLRILLETQQELQGDLAHFRQSLEQNQRRQAEAVTRLQVLREQRAQMALSSIDPGLATNPEGVLAQVKQEAFRWTGQGAAMRNQQALLAEREKVILAEVEEQSLSLGQLQSQVQGVQERRSRREEELTGLGHAMAELDREAGEEQVLQERAAQQKEHLQNGLQDLENSLARIDAQNEILTQREERLFSLKSEVTGILGILADLLQFPDDIAIALHAALGLPLSGLVVENWGKVKEILSRRLSFPITLLPLQEMRSTAHPPMPQGAGVLGRASELVTCEERLRPLVDALLGSTVIVQNLDTAFRIHNHSFKVVTLSGEVLSPQGGVEAGYHTSHRHDASRVTSLADEKRKLEVDLEKWEKELDTLLAKAQERERQKRVLSAQETRLEEDRAKYLFDEERMKQEREWREKIKWQKEGEIAVLREEMGKLHARLEDVTVREEASLARLEALQTQLTRGSHLGQEKTSPALLQERIDRAQELVSELERVVQKSQVEVGEKETRLQDLSQQQETLQSEIQSFEGEAVELASSLGGVQQKIGPAQEELVSLWEARRENEVQESHERQALFELEAEHGSMQGEIEKWRERLSSLKTQIEIDLESVAISPPPARQLPLDIGERLNRLPEVREVSPEVERRMRSLKRTLHTLGGVDVGILSEYQELKSRNDFLSEQSQDLKQAERDLRKMISELDLLIEEKFLSTFQRVSAEFEAAFSRLFAGGRGRLLLTDPQSLAETGVEILAQPPGKRRQSLATLSGGERALTGVALVFALLRAGTSPFCFLDEVDAMLDESNIRRFREALLSLAEETQVVIITHNRGTVEAAQTIYGVTIEDSTSRVLSLRLEEAVA